MWADPFIARAWLLPVLGFNVNRDRHDGKLESCEWPSSWRSYPPMPHLLPFGDLYLRFTLTSTGLDQGHGWNLRLLLLRSGERPVLECQAWRVTAALMGMLSLDHLALDPRECAPVPIPDALMPAHELNKAALLDALGHNGRGLRLSHPYLQTLSSCSMMAYDWLETIKYLSAFLVDDDLWRAGQYYLGSASLFAFVGNDVGRTLHDRELLPENPYRLVDAESAIWLAFKAVEAIIGDPSGREEKLSKAIADAGLYDFPGVWRDEEQADLVDHLLRFVALRDSRVAHGKHHRKRAPVTLFDVMNAQYLSRGLILHYAEEVLRRRGLPTPNNAAS